MPSIVGILTDVGTLIHAREWLGVIEEPFTRSPATASRLRLSLPATPEAIMATLRLGLAGQLIGASIGGGILGISAATIGGAIGTMAGSVVDSWIRAPAARPAP
ncbi:hypothetical protein ACFOHS_22705 [Jhaorihella thermophila]